MEQTNSTTLDEKRVDSSVVASGVIPPNKGAHKGAVAKPPAKVSKWILFSLWFNTYRFVSTLLAYLCRSAAILIVFVYEFFRKLFTFVFTLNVVGLCLAASGHFPYAVQRTSAMALGNLSCAILMRNELFGRFLYLFVTTCFAKVTTQTF